MSIADHPQEYDHVFTRLDGVRRIGDRDEWKCRCPSHDDAHPSMELKLGDDGRLLVCCHRNNSQGCSNEAIMRSIGLSLKDLFPDSQSRLRGGFRDGRKLGQVYHYRSEEGKLLFQVCRYRMPDGSKMIRVRRPHPDPQSPEPWLWSIDGVRRVLYRLPDLLEAFRDAQAAGRTPRAVQVEGEKAADALWSVGIPATCSPGGAGKFHLCDFQALAGADVVVCPDLDPQDPKTKTWPGQDHAEDVCRRLFPIANSVKYLDLPGLPLKGDAHDWVAAHPATTSDAEVERTFWSLAEAAPLWVPPGQPHPLFAAAERAAPDVRLTSRAAWVRQLRDATDWLREADPQKAAEAAGKFAALLLAGAETFLDLRRVERALPPPEEPRQP